MSETAEVPKSGKGQLAPYLKIIIAILLLLLVYGSGIIVLPISILTNYKNGNCDTALTLNDLYKSIYPAFMEDETLTSPVMECAIYTLAGRQEASAAWQDALNSYEVYSATYPNGIFVKEAREHSALALVNLAKEQADGKNFSQAVSNLNIVLTKYSDSDATENASDLFPDIYTSWGIDLRNAGDFEGSQRVFSDFKAWAESNQKMEYAKAAQREIAQTYLSWGLELQSKKQFEEAITKLDLAASSDLEPDSATGVAAQVKDNQATLYREWGDYLVEQKDFAAAIEQYKTSISLSASGDQPAVLDALANGYIQWALGLSDQDDFLGALQKLELAQGSSTAEAMKASVENARQDVYLAFSNSSGEQAQQAMRDAAQFVCNKHQQPSLPIFGLDTENIFAVVYGTDQTLPENIAAKTPSQMHFVACVEETSRIIERKIPYPDYLLIREQYAWNVTLHRVENGRQVETMYIEGDEPQPLPTTPFEIAQGGHNQHYFGPKPDIADLANWLLAYLK